MYRTHKKTAKFRFWVHNRTLIISKVLPNSAGKLQKYPRRKSENSAKYLQILQLFTNLERKLRNNEAFDII